MQNYTPVHVAQQTENNFQSIFNNVIKKDKKKTSLREEQNICLPF